MSRVRRRRRAGRRLDRAAAADALAEALAGRRGRLLGGEQVLESLDDRPSPSPAAPVRWRLDTDAAVADVLRRVRRHRRRRVATAAAALAAAALAVPLVQPHGEPAPPAPQRTAPADVPVLTEPTRGSLAADRGFVEAVRRVDWGPMVAPPVADRRVVLATDTPSGRVVLLAGTVDEDVRGTWLTGPVGAAPDDLAPHLPRHLGPLRPAALVLGGPGPATLVVVAGRDDAVEVSPRLQVGPRGTVGRTYRPAPADDGVAVVPLQTTAGGTGASVRVLRDGQPVYRSGVGGPQLPAAAPDPPDLDPPDLDPLRPSAVRPAPRAVAEALTAVAVPLGAEPAALEPQLLWSGALPPAGVPGTVAVLVGRSPGGGLLVVTEAAQVGPGGAGRTVPCGVSTPPGTTDVAGLVVARVCDLSTPTEDGGRWLVVTAPPGAAGAAVLDRRGSVLATLRFDGGGAVGRLPEGARTVRTLDGDGRALAEVPVAAAPTAPFGDYGGGPVG